MPSDDQPTFVLTFQVTHSVQLTASQIWPDGDAPAGPTARDVRAVVERAGGAQAVLSRWLLDRDSLNQAEPAPSEDGRAVVSAVSLRIAGGRIDDLAHVGVREVVVASQADRRGRGRP